MSNRALAAAAVAIAVAATAVAFAVLAAGAAEAKRAARVGCEHQSSASFPGAFRAPANLLASRPRCVPLDVFVDASMTPRRIAVALGRPCRRVDASHAATARGSRSASGAAQATAPQIDLLAAAV